MIQFLGAALVNYAAAIEDENFGCVFDRAESMGNGEDGLAQNELIKSFLNHTFAFGVEGRSGFVKDKDRCVAEKCPGHSNSLLLTAGQSYPPFPNNGFVSIFLLLNKIVSIGLLGGLHNFLVCCRFPSQANVFHYGVVEKNGILCDDCYFFPEGEGVDLPDINSIQADASRVDVVETWNEIGECAFAGPAGSY